MQYDLLFLVFLVFLGVVKEINGSLDEQHGRRLRSDSRAMYDRRSVLNRYLQDNSDRDKCSNPETHTVDVVIIGAGYAGVRAAATIRKNAPKLKVVVLESTDHLGGRAKSKRWNGVRVELGPKYLNKETKILELFESYNCRSGLDDALNMTVFGFNDNCAKSGRNRRKLENTRKLEKAQELLDRIKNDETIHFDDKMMTVQFLEKAMERRIQKTRDCVVEQLSQKEIKSYKNFWQKKVLACVLEKSNSAWYGYGYDAKNEPGLLVDYIKCGYDDKDPYEYMIKWFWSDFNFSDESGSLYSISDPWEEGGETRLSIKGGIEKTIQMYAKENKIKPLFGHRVKKIWYNIREKKIRAKVKVRTIEGDCIFYKAQRVISTVSSGVYNHNLIEFSPKLRYNERKYNPFKVKQYFNVFYKFDTKFWEKKANQTHYIYTVRLEDYDGISMNWENLDREGVYPGSKILMLTLADEGFRKFFDDNFRSARVPNSKLEKLLEPLKAVFGDKYENPVDILYNKYHADKNFGFGTYSQWVEGYSPTDYFNFWGAYDKNNYIDYCDHNGCNGDPWRKDTEWILYFSGCDSCLNHWGLLNGAWYSGEMSAYLMMESLGIKNLPNWRDTNQCYTV